MGATLSVCSPTLDFGNVLVPGFAELNCTVTNTGPETLTGVATITGNSFSVEPDEFSLSTGQSDTLLVRFTPNQLGRTQQLLFVNFSGGSTAIPVSGTGISTPVLGVSNPTLNFGNARVGGSRELALSIFNAGAGTLTRNVCVSSPFALVSPEPFSVAGGQSEVLVVRFSPPNIGQFESTIFFSTTPCSPQPRPDPSVVLVSGNGVSETAPGEAYVVNRASDNVSVVNTVAQKVEATIPVGTQPVSIALIPDARKIYVVNFLSNDVSVIDTATRQETQRIAVGLNPREIVISADGRRAYVANAGPGEDSVSILDLTSNQLLSTQKIRRPLPSVLALSPDDKVLYALGTGSNWVGLLETTTNLKA